MSLVLEDQVPFAVEKFREVVHFVSRELLEHLGEFGLLGLV
jgi:hypothetical protein